MVLRRALEGGFTIDSIPKFRSTPGSRKWNGFTLAILQNRSKLRTQRYGEHFTFLFSSSPFSFLSCWSMYRFFFVFLFFCRWISVLSFFHFRIVGDSTQVDPTYLPTYRNLEPHNLHPSLNSRIRQLSEIRKTFFQKQHVSCPNQHSTLNPAPTMSKNSEPLGPGLCSLVGIFSPSQRDIRE